MVKCVVSACPNRMVSRRVFNRPPKRFFNFPRDPARVQVWLAALRQSWQHDSTEQHFICEDHFLPEDLSAGGITSGAVPIMPPFLDGSLGLVSPWGAESSEEEERWVPADCEDEGSGDEAPDPPQQNPGGGLENTRAFLPQRRQASRQDVSLGLLTLRFLELLLVAPDGALDLREAAASLQTRKRRVYDITHVLTGFNLLEKDSTNWVRWIGKTPIGSFLWKNPQKLERELENLKTVESTLDGLIKSCAKQLLDMTDDEENSASAYVTHEDIRRLWFVQQQTVIVVKAPEETRLEIPAPQEDRVQVQLKASRGPIVVRTSEFGSGDVSFVSLEESRVQSAAVC
ncbi:transcription factor E2F6-like [Centropristis striata]|uniref:transcription factor E2F6-like n=1 Tax=Centropristis striata TaxID=184440 RepID=UPI0027E0378C|nr:transcription factor E2F6-like [Centropristis striata]XP_059212485.1 transcription factor E2F6-like [Centropristis striata]